MKADVDVLDDFPDRTQREGNNVYVDRSHYRGTVDHFLVLGNDHLVAEFRRRTAPDAGQIRNVGIPFRHS